MLELDCVVHQPSCPVHATLRTKVPVAFWIWTAIVSLVVNDTECVESVQDDPPLAIVHVTEVALPFFSTVSVTPLPPTADPA